MYQKDFVVDNRFVRRITKSGTGLLVTTIKDLCQPVSEDANMEFAVPPVDQAFVIDQVADSAIHDTIDTAVKFSFIGTGQAGGKICEKFYHIGYRRIVAVNTTAQDFAGLSFENKIDIGDGISGAGKDPAQGKQAVLRNKEPLLRAFRKALGTETEHIMIVSSGGGGSGSGSCVELVKYAKEYMEVILEKPAKVGVIVSLPKKAEGQKVRDNAETLMSSLREMARSGVISPLVVVDNEKILKLYPRVSVANFFDIVNKNITSMFNMFNQLSAQHGEYQNLDRADYRSILDNGLATFGVTPIDNPDSDVALAAAIEKNTKLGLLADYSIKGATHAGAILVATKKRLTEIPQASFDLAFNTLQRVLESEKLVLHTGVYEGPESMGDKAYLYSMIGGIQI